MGAWVPRCLSDPKHLEHLMCADVSQPALSPTWLADLNIRLAEYGPLFTTLAFVLLMLANSGGEDFETWMPQHHPQALLAHSRNQVLHTLGSPLKAADSLLTLSTQ